MGYRVESILTHMEVDSWKQLYHYILLKPITGSIVCVDWLLRPEISPAIYAISENQTSNFNSWT